MADKKIGPRRARMGEEAWAKLDNFTREMLETEDRDDELTEMASRLAKLSEERERQRADSVKQ